MKVFEDFDPEAAVSRLMDIMPGEDGILRHDDRHDVLGLPRRGTMNDHEAEDQLRFEAVQRWQVVQALLLRDHKIAFRTTQGQGHTRVRADEQVAWAQAEGVNSARKAMDKAAFRMEHVDLSRLDNVQQQERVDSMARVSHLRQAMDGRRTKRW